MDDRKETVSGEKIFDPKKATLSLNGIPVDIGTIEVKVTKAGRCCYCKKDHHDVKSLDIGIQINGQFLDCTTALCADCNTSLFTMSIPVAPEIKIPDNEEWGCSPTEA